MARYYDRAGVQLKFSEWMRLMNADEADRVVAQLWLAPKKIMISTMWIGLDMRPDGEAGAPLVFETAIVKTDKNGLMLGEPIEVLHYATEAEAVAGHRMATQRYTNGGGKK